VAKNLSFTNFAAENATLSDVLDSRSVRFLHLTEDISVPSKKPVIAIVDDDEAVREALADLVTSLGYVALKYSGAQEFLDSPRRPRISCLISDVQMPGMNGLDLFKRIAASRTPIPTILITAYPKDEARDLALKAGVLCYLKKPFEEQTLLDCIQSALGLSCK